MKIEDVEGVVFVDRPFFSTEIVVHAGSPVAHSAPDYNQRRYDLERRIAKSFLEEKRGYDRLKIILHERA